VKRYLARRPSPALVISLIALFVAMSGTGYAVSKVGSKQLKKNAVTSSKIKKNAVTSSKIKKNALTGPKIKKDSIKGDDILESSIAKVPDADKLDGLDSTAYEKSSKFTRIALFSLGNNETKDIYSLGPFKLTAKCQLAVGGTDDFARILISTTQDNSSFDGADIGPDLDTGTAEANRAFVESVGNPVATPVIDAETDGAAIAPDGTQFVAQLWAGSNILGQSSRCSFGGLIEQVS